MLAGGVGGSRFVAGVRAAYPQAQLTVVVNTADDITLHGLRICPDLDTMTYTLGRGIDADRGWGRSGESWRVKDELAAYGLEPSWFGLGDLDLATHLVRTQLLAAGLPLSEVTRRITARWLAHDPLLTVLPMTDDDVETEVADRGPGLHRRPPLAALPGVLGPAAGRARCAGRPPDRDRAGPPGPRGGRGDRRGRPGPGRSQQPGRLHRTDPGGGGYPGRPPLHVSPGDRVRRHPRRGARCSAWRTGCCPPSAWPSTRQLSVATTGARSSDGVLDLWVMDSADAASAAALEADGLPVAVTGSDHEHPRGHRRVRPVGGQGPARLMVLLFAPPGLGEIVPGTDLVAEILRVTESDPGPLRPGDVVVVTSKIISKAEGRYAGAADREHAITAETRAVVAQRGPMRIVRTHSGLTLAAAGVDTSNVEAGRILLLPVDPDASAERLAAGLSAAVGGDVGRGRLRHRRSSVAAGSDRPRDRRGPGAGAGRVRGAGGRLRQRAGRDHDGPGRRAGRRRRPGQDQAGRASGGGAAWPARAGRSAACGVTSGAAAILRTGREDLFSHGSREAVLAALCRALEVPEAYAELVGADPDATAEALLGRGTVPADPAELVRRLLAEAQLLGSAGPALSPPG